MVFVDGQEIMVGLTVAVAMIVVVTFAKLLGGLLPMAAKKVGVDPGS